MSWRNIVCVVAVGMVLVMGVIVLLAWCALRLMARHTHDEGEWSE